MPPENHIHDNQPHTKNQANHPPKKYREKWVLLVNHFTHHFSSVIKKDVEPRGQRRKNVFLQTRCYCLLLINLVQSNDVSSPFMVWWFESENYQPKKESPFPSVPLLQDLR